MFFHPWVVLAHAGGLIQVSRLDVVSHETESDNGQGKAPRYMVSRGHTGSLSCVSGVLCFHSAHGSFPKSQFCVHSVLTPSFANMSTLLLTLLRRPMQANVGLCPSSR